MCSRENVHLQLHQEPEPVPARHGEPKDRDTPAPKRGPFQKGRGAVQADVVLVPLCREEPSSEVLPLSLAHQHSPWRPPGPWVEEGDLGWVLVPGFSCLSK